MKSGTGFCNERNAFQSGKKAVSLALQRGDCEKADLCIAFCSGATDAEEFFRGMRSELGPGTPILGGSAVGIITNDSLSYSGCPAGASVMQWNNVHIQISSADGLDKDEYEAGTRMAKRFSCGENDKFLLTFYDSVKVSPSAGSPPVMNASPPLIAGIEAATGTRVPIVGGGLMGDYGFGPTSQFCGSFVGTQHVAGILIGGDIEPHIRIMHGFTPKDGIYHTITRMQGPFIFEVDGIPVVEMIDSIYGNPNWRSQQPLKRLAIGVNHGEKFEDYREGSCVTRLIAGILPGNDGIVLFEPDLSEGSEILFMLRDSKTIIESARENAIGLMRRIESSGKTPRFALYIDCAGRTAMFSETLTEEAAEVQNVMNLHGVPLLGFYSGVEIAPLLGRSRGLDWTGVLIVFSD